MGEGSKVLSGSGKSMALAQPTQLTFAERVTEWARKYSEFKTKDEISKAVEAVKGLLGQFVIKGDEDLAAAEHFRTRARDELKAVERAYDERVGPLYRIYKDAAAEYEPFESVLKAIIKNLGSQMADYQVAKERRIQEEVDKRNRELEKQHERAEKRAEKKGVPPPPPPPAIRADIPKKIGSSTFTKTWTFSVIPGEESKIPERFWIRVINEDAIKAAIQGGARNPDIPGVNIYEKTGVRGS